MKCIRCQVDNTLRDRRTHSGRCKNCRHPFAFEPTSMGSIKITDQLFKRAIEEVSANNSLYFTSKQLYYSLERRLGSWRYRPLIRRLANSNSSVNWVQSCGCLLLIIGFILVIAGVDWIIFVIGFATLIIGGLFFQPSQPTAPTLPSPPPRPLQGKVPFISQAQFEIWLNQWRQVNSVPDRLLMSSVSERIPPPQASNRSVSADVSDYSFDRAIVCDKAAIARILIQNNFHFENNCAVLSLDGYPHQIFETTMQMLRRNPDLKVYALHDCSLQGVGLAHLLRTDPEWFQSNSATIIDVGLMPRQVMFRALGLPIHKRFNLGGETLPLDVRSTLSEAEIQWLEAGNYVELEVFSPRKLIQILQQGIAQTRTPDDLETSSGILVVDTSGSNFYAIESFG